MIGGRKRHVTYSEIYAATEDTFKLKWGCFILRGEQIPLALRYYNW